MRKRKDKLPGPWRWTAGRLRGSGRALALLCAGTMASGAGTVALALTVGQVVNHGAGGAAALWDGLLLLLAAGLLALVLWQRWYAGRLRDRLTRETRRDLLAGLLSRRYDALDRRHSGELVSRLGEDVNVVCGEIVSLLPGLTGAAVRLAGAAAALLWLDRTLGLLLLAAGLALAAGAAGLRFPLRRRSTLAREADSAVRQGMQECLENRETAKGLCLEAELVRRTEGLLDGLVAAREGLRRLSLAASGGLAAVTQLGYCAVLIWCAGLVAGGEMTFGAMTTVLQLLVQLRNPVVTLSGAVPRLAALSASAQRLAELEALPAEEPGEALPEGARPRALVFSHVSFAYPDGGRPVLTDVSFRVEAGRWTCLTGPSGLGKSTVVKLALGFYRPQAGEVFFETDRGRLPCGGAARRLLGYVPQDHALFWGTVRDNLLLAAPEADEKALWAALDGAGAGFVRDLPRGLDTPIREKGGGLSQGQGQRIALARALLLDAPFLLLDECTSALDRETEREVLSRLRRAGRGALVITHRPDALPEGTEVIRMEEEV